MFSSNLKRILNQQNLQQKELAKMIGVSPQSVSQWVSGHKVPRMNMMNAICDALGCSLADLTEPYLPSITQEILNILKPMTEIQKYQVLAYAKFISQEGDK